MVRNVGSSRKLLSQAVKTKRDTLSVKYEYFTSTQTICTCIREEVFF